MNNSEKKLTEKELKLIEETEAFMEEVYSNPEVADTEPPTDLRGKVFAEIHAREAAKKEEFCAEEKLKETDSNVEKVAVEEETHAEKLDTEEKVSETEKLTAEEKELIRLGRIYKKRKRLQKYVVLAAVLILAMAFGMTSIGGPKKVFEKLNWFIAGREQVNVDSDDEDVVPTSGMYEEEAYQEIEEKFGFVPVQLLYLPKRVGFLEVEIGEEIQCINLVYGNKNDVKIIYTIRPNYRDGSLGKDIEDDFVEEYFEENGYTTIYIRKYLLDRDEERWSVQFEYKETLYSMTIIDTSRGEVEEIVKNLHFS